VLWPLWWAAERSEGRVFRALAERGVRTTAVVVSEPQNHDLLRYRFAAAGKTYQASPYDTADADRHPVGSAVEIVYDPRHPTYTCTCNPQEYVGAFTAARTLLVGACLAVALSPIPVAIVGYRRRWWHRERTEHRTP
jgi:predicted nucleotidyltransferase